MGDELEVVILFFFLNVFRFGNFLAVDHVYDICFAHFFQLGIVIEGYLFGENSLFKLEICETHLAHVPVIVNEVMSIGIGECVAVGAENNRL